MVYHFIAIASSYTNGFRIAWHYSSKNQLDVNVIKNFMMVVEKHCKEQQLAYHKLTTQSLDFESVKVKDPFFDDVIVTTDIRRFIELLSADKELTALDVAKFILSIQSMTHLKLQKVLYYAYANFYLETGKKLFDEPILAYQYGPVIKSVYQRYKVNKQSLLDEVEDNKNSIETHLKPTISFMKIVSSDNGIEAVQSIVQTIKQYTEFTASELVEKTHAINGPWHRVYKEMENCVITDEMIQKYHYLVK